MTDSDEKTGGVRFSSKFSIGHRHFFKWFMGSFNVLERVDHLAAGSGSQILIGRPVDVFRNELNGTVP